MAAGKGHKETVEYLVNNKAKINVKDDTGVCIETLLLAETVYY